MKSVELLVFCIGFVGLVAISQVTAATDYCDKALCGKAEHIACNNTGEFATTCSSDKKLIKISPDFRRAMVKQHNKLRNQLASGDMKPFEPSPRMASMQWNNELADLAELNVKTCKFAHDACHNTKNFSTSGQNIAITWSSDPIESQAESIILSMIDSWWAEKNETSMKEINSYPENFEHVIGHFTVMAVEENNRMGCAASSYRDPEQENWFTILYTCNYAKTNIFDRSIYSTGKSASKCTSGVNPNFKSLCAQKEVYGK
ncbi:antigen 5 like allergen Cul n 1-like [Episyrphus balteatus]|uniref:antigen 5 like allergen Cul n 1-like n=1 Tax=Episyrphus balteatus TaxID=286459 RepID=UPI00248632AB|nr:antigen 5 like allergen Cul n 1-like [Episyrphus balteatus]